MTPSKIRQQRRDPHTSDLHLEPVCARWGRQSILCTPTSISGRKEMRRWGGCQDPGRYAPSGPVGLGRHPAVAGRHLSVNGGGGRALALGCPCGLARPQQSHEGSQWS